MKVSNLFMLGVLVGLGVAGTVYATFSFALVRAFPYQVVSAITLLGFGFAIGGYLQRWRGDRSPGNYFILGLGIGILMIAFIGAGNGINPMMGAAVAGL